MEPPDDDRIYQIAKRLEGLLGEMSGPKREVNLRVAVEDLFVAIADIWEDADEDDEQETEGCGECPSCSDEAMPRIRSLSPAPLNYKAVFAEGDESDPTKMKVDDVIAFAVVEFPDGDSDVMGVTFGESRMVPCELIGTFIGYLKPGQDPSIFASKVREFLKEQKE